MQSLAQVFRRFSKSNRKMALAIYVFCTVVYAGTAGQRLLHPSSDTHFVYQAESWLQRRLDLTRPPPHQNDWAEIESLKLRDGTQISGQFLRSSPERFRPLRGDIRTIHSSDIAARTRKYYVSFPPFPALLMLPAVAMFGHRTNDVLFCVLLAGLVPALLYVILRRLPTSVSALSAFAENATPPTVSIAASLSLTALFAFGSVFYFSAVMGQVWFTAHMVSLCFCGLYLLCTLRPRPQPLFAGLCIGALYLTRPQMAALGLLFVWQLWQQTAAEENSPTTWIRRVQRIAGRLSLFLIPCALFFAAGSVHNYLRFEHPLEFGHTYLTTMQADNIQRFGLMNYQYLPRNLASALCLLPKLLPTAPYVQISYHGLALWFTTPGLLYLLWPERENVPPKARQLAGVLLVCALPIALCGLLYQNDGYVQFGYRFSLDYLLPLILSLALLRPRAVTSLPFVALGLWSIAVNLFGAISFGRLWQFYFNGFFPVS